MDMLVGSPIEWCVKTEGNMDASLRANEIEDRCLKLIEQECWHEARQCFEGMLLLPLDPMRQVKYSEI
jgi:hypothetical protein